MSRGCDGDDVMGKNKEKGTLISKKTEYNEQMASTSTSPENDSPGDSEDDSGSEFLMGLNYMPDEKNEFEGARGEEPGEIVFSDGKPKASEVKPEKKVNLPGSAKVVSSDQPAPWSDLDTSSDTH